ncbi:MAG: DUF2029 domain-containing protein [Chloroflexi bacterium]|nr:DUF2029 domain-containing protein [Chloroflexota bacterium]
MENRSTSTIVLILFAALVCLALAGLTYANYQFAQQNPGGNDFLSRWVGTRLFLTRGISPYSAEATQQIQEMAYGRAAQTGEDQMLFVYPLYTVVVIAPFAMTGDYALARALWMTALEAVLVLLTFSGLALTRWKPPRWLLISLLVFALLGYHGLRPVINGNPAVMVALFVALTFLALRADLDALAGFLLALSTIKPQTTVLLILLILIWAGVQRRWTVLGSFAGTLALLSAAGSLLVPDWILQNIRQALAYPGYTLAGTPGEILAGWLPGVGKQLGWLLSAILVGMLLREWRAALGKDVSWLAWTGYLTLTITNLIGIRTATENYVILFPGLLVVFAVWDLRWKGAGRLLTASAMALLGVGLWALFIGTLIPADQPTQNPVMFFPYPIFLLLSLYWVRWWALRPPRLYVDDLRASHVGES